MAVQHDQDAGAKPTTLEKVNAFFNSLQQNLADIEEADVTYKMMIQEGIISIFFNIDDLKLSVEVEQKMMKL